MKRKIGISAQRNKINGGISFLVNFCATSKIRGQALRGQVNK